MLKKSFILFFSGILFLFISCEEIPTETVDLQTVDYVIQKIVAPDVVTFSSTGTEIVTSLTIQNKETVNKVWFNISSDDGVSTLTTGNSMIESGDAIFSGKYLLNESLLGGMYEISYYVEDKIRIAPNNVSKVGTKSFTYISKADNYPPKISNLNMITSIDKGVKFSFSVVVSDSNGLSDIDIVYYLLTDPSGSLISNSEGISKFPLYDDGNFSVHSDNNAGDGIFSTNLTFPSSVSTGNWEFKFIAKDKSDSQSNTIIQNVNVK